MKKTATIMAITMGDPAGIGPELALLGASQSKSDRKILIVGDRKRLELALEILVSHNRLPESTQLVSISSPRDGWRMPLDAGTIGVIDLNNVPADLPWGMVTPEGGKASFSYVTTAIHLALNEDIDGVCTGPINKKAWEQAHVPYPGHTEVFASLCNVKDYAMMLINDSLRVVHVTTHQSLVQAIQSLSIERIVKTGRLTNRYLQQVGMAAPKVAVAGLNPHAGEYGLFGREEIEIIRPAVEQMRQEGLRVSGPYPADTVFARAQSGEFDAVVALFHDQGHIAIKMLGLDTGVNVTIGLPILRTSVDHGTAFDIAGKGIVRERSMIAALQVGFNDITRVGRMAFNGEVF